MSGDPAAPSRSELKNAEARAKLVPLREGERPAAVTISAAICIALLVTNIGLAAGGYKHSQPLPGVIVFTALLAFVTYGLWKVNYWAVLGFEALLGITILLFSLRLPFAANLTTVFISLAVLVPSTVMFWYLIKAMARIQMPERQ